jgi:hypothetical protein
VESFPRLKLLNKSGDAIATRVTHGAAFAGAHEMRVTTVTVKPAGRAYLVSRISTGLTTPKQPARFRIA